MKATLLFAAAGAVALSAAACTQKKAEESAAPTTTGASSPAAGACPNVAMKTAPLGAAHGATFTVEVTPSSEAITYNWTVSAGMISSGQGTQSITVEAPPGPVTASLDLGGLDLDCTRFVSETAEVQ